MRHSNMRKEENKGRENTLLEFDEKLILLFF
ncbi:hypothetical protein KOW_01609 [Bacillus cereus VDM006]|nr:hypothetical protein KOW_01609 [Bacillus cereus VDM006]